ncbi:MAG: hypothetical protein GY726_15275 [Proteobacteria bacterium]|nr:hypothetical protein [Pseudomonadota bacterium]
MKTSSASKATHAPLLSAKLVRRLRLSSGLVMHGLEVEKIEICGREQKLLVYPMFAIEALKNHSEKA